MAETTKFVLEGSMELAFISSDNDSKHVLINDGDEADCVVGPAGSCKRLETKIADELDFPSEEEYDILFRKLEELREKKLRPIEGEPDVTREVNLRITVEVI